LLARAAAAAAAGQIGCEGPTRPPSASCLRLKAPTSMLPAPFSFLPMLDCRCSHATGGGESNGRTCAPDGLPGEGQLNSASSGTEQRHLGRESAPAVAGCRLKTPQASPAGSLPRATKLQSPNAFVCLRPGCDCVACAGYDLARNDNTWLLRQLNNADASLAAGGGSCARRTLARLPPGPSPLPRLPLQGAAAAGAGQPAGSGVRVCHAT